MVNVLRWILPPIIYVLGRKILPFFGRNPAGQQALKDEFDLMNRDVGHDTIVLRPGLSLLAHPDSLMSFRYFCYLNVRARLELDAFIRLSERKRSFLDIGALHGMFSLVFAKQGPGKKVIAVDPSPIAFSKLLYNITKNSFDNVCPLECAVSNRSGYLEMGYEWEHLVSGSSSDSLLRIPSRTGEAICKEYDFVPDIIKIDVEGHEVKVLQGLARVLKDHKPIVFMEFHPVRVKEGGDDLYLLTDLLTELRYRAWKVNGELFPLPAFTTASKDENLILVSIETEEKPF